MKAALLAALLAALSLSAPAVGYLPVEEGLAPLRERLALIERELPRLEALAQVRPGREESRQALIERARAWAQLQDLREERARLKDELAAAQQAAKDPMRLH